MSAVDQNSLVQVRWLFTREIALTRGTGINRFMEYAVSTTTASVPHYVDQRFAMWLRHHNAANRGIYMLVK